MINSTYNPKTVADFNKDYLNVDHQGVGAIVPAGTVGNIDYTLSDDHLLVGAILLAENTAFDDSICLQIIHPTMGVVNQFVTNWAMSTDKEEKFNRQEGFPAKIPAGLKIRCAYTSTGSVDVKVKMNLFLHKILV